MTFFFAVAGLPGAPGRTQPAPFLNYEINVWAADTCSTWSGKRGWGVALRARGQHAPAAPLPAVDGGGLPSGCAATAILVRADTPKDTEIDR